MQQGPECNIIIQPQDGIGCIWH